MRYLIILFCFSVSAQDYWMPRETLKNKLNIYAEPNSKSQVICAVDKGMAIRQVEDSGKWMKVLISLCDGYVYKASITPFKTSLTYMQGLAADEIEIHRVDKIIYFDVGGWCYFINVDNLKNIPTGKDNAITIRTHLDNRGGFDKPTDKDKANCNFH